MPKQKDVFGKSKRPILFGLFLPFVAGIAFVGRLMSHAYMQTMRRTERTQSSYVNNFINRINVMYWKDVCRASLRSYDSSNIERKHIHKTWFGCLNCYVRAQPNTHTSVKYPASITNRAHTQTQHTIVPHYILLLVLRFCYYSYFGCTCNFRPNIGGPSNPETIRRHSNEWHRQHHFCHRHKRTHTTHTSIARSINLIPFLRTYFVSPIRYTNLATPIQSSISPGQYSFVYSFVVVLHPNWYGYWLLFFSRIVYDNDEGMSSLFDEAVWFHCWL